MRPVGKGWEVKGSVVRLMDQGRLRATNTTDLLWWQKMCTRSAITDLVFYSKAEAYLRTVNTGSALAKLAILILRFRESTE